MNAVSKIHERRDSIISDIKKQTGPIAISSVLFAPQDQRDAFYSNLIQSFKELASLDRGISWNVNSKNDFLIRDGNHGNSEVFSKNDYMQQILNMHRAAITLLDINGNTNVKQDILSNTKKLLENYTQSKFPDTEEECIKILKEQNTETIKILKDSISMFSSMKDKEIDKELRLSEFYSGLNDNHPNIETHLEIEGEKFILRDTKISLTEKQKEELSNRHSKEWYKELSKNEQKLLDINIDKILSGDTVLPSIANIPGIKNAYKKEVIQIDADDNEKILSTYYHCAAISTFNESKEAQESFAKDNFAQILQDANSQNVTFITLCSEYKDKRTDDSRIIEQTRAATDIKFLNISANLSDRLETHGNFKEFIEDNQQRLMPTPQAIKGNDMIKDCHDKMNQQKLLIPDIGKPSLTAQQVATTNKEYDPQEMVAAFVPILSHQQHGFVISCKSGKDRTGCISHLHDSATIAIHNPEIKMDAISSKIASGAHIQSMVGEFKPGCVGLRRGPGAVQDDKLLPKALFCDSAKFYISISSESKIGASRDRAARGQTSATIIPDTTPQAANSKTNRGYSR